MEATAGHSAFFFSGRLMPAELANFNVQNVLLRDRKGARLEILSHCIAIWWPSRPRNEFDDLADAARRWIRTIASAYYLETDIPLEPDLVGWVEALDVQAEEAVVGFADPRFLKVKTPPAEADENRRMREAIKLAVRLRRRGGDLERATHEALAAANDGTPQSFLSAYRALECVRRIYEPAWAQRARGWTTMGADLALQLGAEYLLLEQAAQAIRHGDIPARRSARHVVNRARRRRDELPGFTTRLVVHAATERHA